MPEFTEDQMIKIAEVLDVTRDSLQSQIVYLGSRVTQKVIDRIAVHLASWDEGIGSNFLEIHPNTANFGAKISAENAREQIQNSIRSLLEIDGYGSGSSPHTVYLERG